MIRPLDRKMLLVILLLVAAGWLRMYRVEVLDRASNDERLWLMAGVSLLKEGVPTAWTIQWSQHRWDKYWRVEDGVVTPWLDHPPLFALLTGGWALLMGVDDIDKPTQAVLRFPMVVMSVATIYITYLLVREIFNEKMAVIVLAVYTFFPTDLVASRFILAEHTFPLLLMLGLYAFVKHDQEENKKRKRSWLIVMSVVSIVSPLMKLSGVVVPIALVLLSWLRKKKRLGWWFSLMGVLSVLFFWVYAWAYSWEVYIGAQEAHLQRPQSFDHFWSFFTQLSAGNVLVFDPTVIMGWAGVLVIMSRKGKKLAKQIIFAPAVAISFVFLYVASVENYDWYKYPAYPLLAIGAGFMVYQLQRGRYWYLVFFLPLLAQMLQNSGLVVDQMERRLWMVLMYGVVMLSVLVRSSFWQFKKVVIFFLLVLFFFEVVWYLHMLGSACWLSDCFPVQFRV